MNCGEVTLLRASRCEKTRFTAAYGLQADTESGLGGNTFLEGKGFFLLYA